MAVEDWIDVPKGIAGASTAGTALLVLAGAMNVRDGHPSGWLLLAGGVVLGIVSSRLVTNYVRDNRTEAPRRLPDPDGPEIRDPGSNVKRLD